MQIDAVDPNGLDVLPVHDYLRVETDAEGLEFLIFTPALPGGANWSEVFDGNDLPIPLDCSRRNPWQLTQTEQEPKLAAPRSDHSHCSQS